MENSKTVVKQTARSLRIWIEGGKLARAGFASGVAYSIAYDDAAIVLTVDPEASRRVTCSKRGESARPIVDLHSKAVGAVFAAGDRLAVNYSAGSISIVLE